MRLISSVKRLEAGAQRAREQAPIAVGLVWSNHETTVDPEMLEAGEYLAADIWIEGGPEATVAGAAEPATWWKVKERVTLDPQDLGLVYDSSGVRIGRVMELDGSMVTIERDELSPAD